MASCPTCKGEFENSAFCPKDGTRLVDGPRLLGDRYRLIRKVGAGAMGEVYEAEHVYMKRRVAVKLLHRHFASNAELIARLQREAQTTSGLGHPNIVESLDFGHAADGQVYLVMEWLDGESLAERIERAPIDLDTALLIARQTCAGAAEAHDHGVIHRDLKPANLFLTKDRRGELQVKVLDFGIAKLAQQGTELTGTGILIGTPNYMAPEQAMGEALDGRADIYAVGVILYEMLTGAVPFQADTPLAVLHQHTTRMPMLPSARAPERPISAALDDLVFRCLAKLPEDRFGSMGELGVAIEDIRAGRSVPVTPREIPITSVPAPAAADDDGPLLPARSISRRTLWVGLATAAALIGGVVIFATTRGGGGASAGPAADAVFAVSADAAVVPADASVASTTLDGSIVAAVPIDGPLVIGVPIDAAFLVTADAAPAREVAPTATGRGARFSYRAWAVPEAPSPGGTVALRIVLDDLDPSLRAAVAAGQLTAKVRVEYFKDHSIAAQTAQTVRGDRTIAVTVSKIRWGKYHVYIALAIDGREKARAKFDLFDQRS